MFQLSINNQNIGDPMSYKEGEFWQGILAATFPDEVIWLKRVTSVQHWAQVDNLIVFPLEKEREVQI